MDFRKNLKKPFTFDPPKKIIVDIQGGLQDILALFCAFRIIQKQSINSQIIGITCVNGRHTPEVAAKSAMAANYLMDACLPIFLGQKQSLILQTKYPDSYIEHHFQQLENELYNRSQAYQKCIQQKKAIDFLIESSQKYGNDLGIIAFGPLTNIGLAQRLENCFDQIKCISINGGQYTGIGTTLDGNVEPNFAYDPLSIHILVESPQLSNKIYINPVQKTLMYNWKKSFRRIYEQSKLDEDKKQLLSILLENQSQFMLWGPFLTILPILCPEYVPFCHQVYAQIIRDSEKTDGLLAINWFKVGSKQHQFRDKIIIYEDFDQKGIEELLIRTLSL